jgi:hypothetical protein
MGKTNKVIQFLMIFTRFLRFFMLIYHKEMMSIILHKFVATIEMFEHVQTLRGLFQQVASHYDHVFEILI